MPSYIVKLSKDNSDYYLEWSTVVDAPISWGMSEEEFKEYYKKKYGESSLSELGQRMSRVNQRGCSSYMDSLEELISYNRAGPGETNLTKEEIVEEYCLRERPTRRPNYTHDEGN